MGNLSDYIGADRRDHHHVCLLGQRNMLHTVLKIPVKSINQALISRKCFKCNGIDKIDRILCHQDMNICMKLLKRAGKGCRFIRSNASRYSQKNCLSCQHVFSPFLCSFEPFPILCEHPVWKRRNAFRRDCSGSALLYYRGTEKASICSLIPLSFLPLLSWRNYGIMRVVLYIFYEEALL